MFRILKSAGRSALADWTLASKALQLFNVEIRPRSFEENGQTENKSSAYEEFLRNSFISHQNNKSEDEEKKFTKLERSSKVALAQSLSIHRPDLVLIAEDGGKVLGHRSLLSLFSSVFRQLLPLHDQHESLLALSLPFTSEPLFAFHSLKLLRKAVGIMRLKGLKTFLQFKRLHKPSRTLRIETLSIQEAPLTLSDTLALLKSVMVPVIQLK